MFQGGLEMLLIISHYKDQNSLHNLKKKYLFVLSFDGKFVSSLFSYMCIYAYTCKQY